MKEFELSRTDKVALFITNKVGTIGFFAIIITWSVIWLTWNTFAPIDYKFDPSPAFVLWLFISNMIQICLMPLIMIGQNIQTKALEDLASKDYELDRRMEIELAEIKKLLISKLDETK